MTDEPAATTRSRALPVWVRVGGAALLAYVIATLAAGAFLARALGDRAAREREEHLDSHLTMLAPPTRRAILSRDYERLDAEVRAAAEIGHLRVTVILPDGTVVAESERSLPLDNHADRPEMIAALAGGRGRSARMSATFGEPFLYVARRLGDEPGRPIGVLRVATPEAWRMAERERLAWLLILSALSGVPVAGLVGWFFARRITRPLEEMTDIATRMAARDFASLPTSNDDDELGRLARALRGMGDELASSLEVSETDRAELEAMLESMVEGVLALDAERRVVRANRGVATVFGLDAAPRPGTHVTELIDDEDFRNVVDLAFSGGRVDGRDLQAQATGARVLNVSAAPIRGAAGVSGTVVVLRDVTEFRRLERARLDFVANVSHELRTPVAAVLGALETADSLEPHEESARERLLDNAYRNAGRLSAIVNDLLALSAIETEETEMERWPVSLIRSIRSAAGSLSAEAERGGITLSLPVPQDPEIEVLAHESRLELVWINLLGNAIKYSARGGVVTVSVQVLASERQAEIAVSDTGQGIPPDKLSRVFERFFRVDKARSRERGGTGLGLAIVKHIVRAHAGSVAVESRLGEGSAFRVRLQLVDPDDPSLAAP